MFHVVVFIHRAHLVKSWNMRRRYKSDELIIFVQSSLHVLDISYPVVHAFATFDIVYCRLRQPKKCRADVEVRRNVRQRSDVGVRRLRRKAFLG